jgi:hypothetical protein
VHVNENSGEFQRFTVDLTVTTPSEKKFLKQKTSREIIWPDLTDIDRTDKCSGGSS